jgi:hypothetical protein
MDKPTLHVELLATEGEEAQRTFSIAFLITVPIFMSYACCFSLQRRLSPLFGLSDAAADHTRTYEFGLAVAFVYIFNLIFRVIGHNLVFGFLSPRNRLICSFVASFTGMTILAATTSTSNPDMEPRSLAPIFIAYAFVGISVGTFSPNMLNIVNHMGQTRTWVIMAMPCGAALVTILGFSLMAVGVPIFAFYASAAVSTALALICYLFTLYRAARRFDPMGDSFSIRQFLFEMKAIKEWFRTVWFYGWIFAIDMFCMSFFSPGLTLYEYRTRVNFHLFGVSIQHDWFMVLYNSGTFLGDVIARKVMSGRSFLHPIWYGIFLAVAVGLNLSLIPEIAPIAAFCFSWTNGSIFGQSTKFLGNMFFGQYHLTAISTWLFLGDVGSVVASNLVHPTRPGIVAMKQGMY